MILILNHYIEQVNEHTTDADISDTKQVLQETEELLEKYDEHLDAEQIGTWLQYHVKEDANMAMQAKYACVALPGIVLSSKYAWNWKNKCRPVRNLYDMYWWRYRTDNIRSKKSIFCLLRKFRKF